MAFNVQVEGMGVSISAGMAVVGVGPVRVGL
jgi:hypothetical protein